MKRIVLIFVVFPLLVIPYLSEAKIVTEEIQYRDGEVVLEGFLVYDDTIKKPVPGILIIHEWMGINDYIKKRAIQVAELGYVAFAGDIYGKGIRPKTREEASKQAGIYKSNIPLFRSRMNAALRQLESFPNVDKGRLAAIGYCFGGTGVLELARSGADVRGVVSFHGGLSTLNPDDTKNIKARVLVLHGADDPFVKIDEVKAFWQEMMNAKARWQMHVYGGSVHSFTNPSSGNDPARGIAYNPYADKHSWQEMVNFLKEIF